jgi:hypothetical protein
MNDGKTEFGSGIYDEGSYESRVLEFLNVIPGFKNIDRVGSNKTGDGWICYSSQTDENGESQVFYVNDNGSAVLLQEELLRSYDLTGSKSEQLGITKQDIVAHINQATNDVLQYLLPFIKEPEGRINKTYITRLFPGLYINFENGTYDETYDFYSRSRAKVFILKEEDFIRSEALTDSHFQITSNAYVFGNLMPKLFNYRADYGNSDIDEARINTSGIAVIVIKENSVVYSHGNFSYETSNEIEQRRKVSLDNLRAKYIHELLHLFNVDDPWQNPYGELATEYLAIRINTRNRAYSNATIGYSDILGFVSILIDQISERLDVPKSELYGLIDSLFVNGDSKRKAQFIRVLSQAFGEEIADRISRFEFNDMAEAINAILNCDDS